MLGLDLVLTEAIKHFLRLGFQKFEASDDTKILRVVLAERLLRELKYDLEIIGEFRKGNDNFLQEIDTRVVEGIFSQPIPISALFPDAIPEDIRGKAVSGNGNYH